MQESARVRNLKPRSETEERRNDRVVVLLCTKGMNDRAVLLFSSTALLLLVLHLLL